METIVTSINIGFGNCVFLNRDPQTIEGIISNKINDPNVDLAIAKPTSVKVEHIDDLHDKLSLAYNGTDNVEGVITWRKSVDDMHYVFANFE